MLTVFQDHTPNGVASQFFGGVIFRLATTIPPNLSYESLRHKVYNEGQPLDGYYTKPVMMKMISEQARQYNMYLIVNNTIQWFDSNISVETYARVSGAIADLLEMDGFTDETAAIALMNEPNKFCRVNGKYSNDKYIEYCQRSNDYVNGRFPLILINDEYYINWSVDVKYILEKTINIPKRIWGVHHLSSLGKTPKWGNIRDCKTIANEYNVPIICDEGGSWFEPYQRIAGHSINGRLIEECNTYDYFGCAIVCVDVNRQGGNKNLGYRVWDKNYTKILSQTNWAKFEDILKKYKGGGSQMPEDRDLKLIPGYMYGEDVKKVQTKLREIGFDLKADSWYGGQTEAAIKKFQELVKIHSDGIVGKITRDMLELITIETFYPEVFQDIYQSKNYSIEAIDYYLNEFAHPDLKGHGKYFVQAEQETGIPIEWQLANGSAESSYKGGGIGSSPIAQKYYNLYGWGIPNSGPTAEGRFGSFQECILYVPKKIKSLFLDPNNWRYNGDNIFGIEIYYSTACYNAINKANQYRKICKFLDADIKIKVPEYIEELIPLLEKVFVKK